jgi:hypothetical protein
MANVPLSGRDGGYTQMICPGIKAKCFCARGWTAKSALILLRKLYFRSTHPEAEIWIDFIL